MDHQRLTQDAAIRVHRVIARLNVGGPARHVVGLNAGLAKRGSFDCTLLAGELGPGEGDMSYLAQEAGLTVHSVAGLGPEPSLANDLRALWWLYRRFRQDRPHIVHTHTAKAGALGRLAATLAGVPVRIHTYHGHVLGGSYFGPTKTSVFRLLERALGRVSTRLVAISPRQLAELSETHRVADARHFECIALGLDLDRFQTVDRKRAGSGLRGALGISAGAWVVGTIGRLVPVKNHALLLRAFATAVGRQGSTGDQARLLIAGDGDSPYREELQRLAANLGVSDQVLWLGWRNDLPELLSAMDAFALTSDDEGTPVALIEALCAGTPVVARDVGGVADIVAGLPTALLVATDDPTDFADALHRSRRLTVDDEQGRAARTLVGTRFSCVRLTHDIDALYRTSLAEVGIAVTA